MSMCLFTTWARWDGGGGGGMAPEHSKGRGVPVACGRGSRRQPCARAARTGRRRSRTDEARVQAGARARARARARAGGARAKARAGVSGAPASSHARLPDRMIVLAAQRGQGGVRAAQQSHASCVGATRAVSVPAARGRAGMSSRRGAEGGVAWRGPRGGRATHRPSSNSPPTPSAAPRPTPPAAVGCAS